MVELPGIRVKIFPELDKAGLDKGAKDVEKKFTGVPLDLKMPKGLRGMFSKSFDLEMPKGLDGLKKTLAKPFDLEMPKDLKGTQKKVPIEEKASGEGGPLKGIFGGGEKGNGFMGGMGKLSSSLMGIFALTEIVKTGVDFMKKITSILSDASPFLKSTLTLIYKSLLLWLKPLGDTIATMLMPITKFFIMLGMALNKMYAQKLQEYIGEGMDPITASIQAATESFVEGIVGLFTGTIGDIDMGTNIQTIIGSVVSAFIEAVKKPEVMADLLLIGGAILAAVGVALVAASVAFTAAMTAISGAISVAAGLGLTTAAPAFAAMGTTIAGTIGAAAALGMAALPALIFVAVAAAMPAIEEYIMSQIGATVSPTPAPETPNIPGGGGPPPINPSLPWWPFAEGGIVTKPTLALIGEGGPEAVIPLNQLGSTIATPTTAGANNTFHITITGPIYGTDDLESKIERMIDEYSDKIRMA